MSAEVVKKRGRPKKVISDPIEVELPEKKNSITRAKSTKATPKLAKTSPISANKISVSSTVSKVAGTASLATKSTLQPAAPSSSAYTKTASKAPAPTLSKAPSKPPVTPGTSKILEQVHELSAKGVAASPDSPKISKPSQTIKTPKPTSIPPQAQPTTPPTSSNSIPTPKKSQTPPAASKPSPKIPLAAMNAEIVSNISTRAGARPNARASGQLPPNYKSVARKYTAAIVAMPILIVTSYVLYERLVLGEDQKVLVRPAETASTDKTREDHEPRQNR